VRLEERPLVKCEIGAAGFADVIKGSERPIHDFLLIWPQLSQGRLVHALVVLIRTRRRIVQQVIIVLKLTLCVGFIVVVVVDLCQVLLSLLRGPPDMYACTYV
jgi:hypothetical protein